MTTAQLAIGQAKTNSREIYLYHPAVDLLLVCGGWLFILVAVNYCLTGGVVEKETLPASMRLLALIGTFLISQPHSAATLFKLYGDRTESHKHKLVAFALPAVLGTGLVAALYSPLLVRLEATLYVGLALHHVMAQCYGIALMYSARASLTLTPLERLLLKATLWTTVAAAISQQLSSEWSRHTLLGIELIQLDFIPPSLAPMMQGAAALCLTLFFILQVRRHFRYEQAFPLPATLTLLTAVALLTIWNSASELVWIFVPPFFHGSQYLCVVMAAFIKQEKSRRQFSSRGTLAEFVAIRLSELFAVGLLLFVAVPKLISLGGAPFALCSNLMFFAIGFHHFAADACIWKLRRARVRNSLSQ